MTLDVTARALADNLVNQFGKTVTLRRTPKSVYDPETGTGGDDQILTDYSVKVTPPTDFMLKRVEGTLIGEGDQVISLPALNAPIVPNKDTDIVIIEDEEWKIRQIGNLWSGEQVAMYILHLTQ